MVTRAAKLHLAQAATLKLIFLILIVEGWLED
jgi:hypothetical protein